jgi:gamma-D-glutamyl-L-lysine dipeptidyl-peptidase
MGKFYYSILLTCSLSVLKSHGQANTHIDIARKLYAPDRRTSIFDIRYDIESNSLKGKTDQVKAKAYILSKLKDQHPKDSISVLTGVSITIVNVAEGNLRNSPEETAELNSQALLGTPLKVLERKGKWLHVQSPDKYIAWIDGSTTVEMQKSKAEIYFKDKKIIFAGFHGKVKRDTSANSWPLRDVSLGAILRVKDSTQTMYEVMLPDNKIGFLPKSDLQYPEVFQGNKTEQDLRNSAFDFLGIPYLWGGTSTKGVDCSGFVRMLYHRNGFYLPRDASQQALLGNPVSIENNFKNLKQGDLLFFGNSQSGRVIHVAMWVGDMQFIHSMGMVKLNSFDEKDPAFDNYNLKRLLFVKRIDLNSIKFTNQNLYSTF